MAHRTPSPDMPDSGAKLAREGVASAPTPLPARFRFEVKLGEGGLGTVVKAYDTKLRTYVAIKTIRQDLAIANPLLYEALHERFEREAIAGARVRDSIYVITIFDKVEDDSGNEFLILPFVPGGTLRDRLMGGPLPVAEALRLTADAARGLQDLHKAGIVHRDVKPGNIFLAVNGRAQIADLGIVQMTDDETRYPERENHSHPGTWLYMSPEHEHTTGVLQPATDQYSLGMVLFELVTGKWYKQLGKDEVDAVLAALPPSVRDLIERMTAEDPDDRYPSMGAVITAIEAVALADSDRVGVAPSRGLDVDSSVALTKMGDTLPVSLTPVEPVRTASPPGKRGVLIGISGFLAVAIIAIGAFFAFNQRGPGPIATAPTGVSQIASTSSQSGTITAATVAVNPTVSASSPSSTTGTPTIAANPSDTITPGGPPVTAMITTPGQDARYTFTGTKGQVVSAVVSSATLGTNRESDLYLLDPDGKQVGNGAGINNGAGFLEPHTLPTSGTYTLVFGHFGTLTGKATVQLYNVVNVTGTINPDGPPVTTTTTTPGQDARYTFTGTKGQVVSAVVSSATLGTNRESDLYLLDPDGKQVGNGAGINNGAGFLEPHTLPTSGTYTLVFGHFGTLTGKATVQLYNVVNVTGTINPDGPPVTTTTTTPGQDARYTFTGTKGQVVSAVVSSATLGTNRESDLYLLDPDGKQVGNGAGINNGAGFLEPHTLPTSGTYTLVFGHFGTLTGKATVQLYNVVNVTGTINPDGPPVTTTTTTPGQDARYTFTGTKGQVVSAVVSSATLGTNRESDLYLLDPDGKQVGNGAGINNGAGFLEPHTLPTSGTYTLVFGHFGTLTGKATVQLYNVVNVTGTINPDGPPVTTTTTTPGQDARYTFTGTKGQVVSAVVSSATLGTNRESDLYLLDPDGKQVGNGAGINNGAGFLEPHTLPTSGTYTLVFGHFGTLTGKATVQLHTVSVP